MIVGNERGQNILQQFFDTIAEKGSISFPFLLLHGPQHIGKTTLVEEHVAKLTGLFAQQDYRALYDLSEKLGKKHTLKVEVPSKDQAIEIDGVTYQDIGARDVISWLSLAPAGDYKVVYLENIERMNLSAANALLKTLEEPLEKRLIVATTTNKEALLDTIVSRAFVIDFAALTDQQIQEYISSHHAEVSSNVAKFLQGFSLGKIGLVENFLTDDAEQLGEMSEHFSGLIEHLQGSSHLVDAYGHMTYFQEQHMWKQLCEALSFVGSAEHSFSTVQQLIQAYQLSGTQVNDAHVAFALSL